MNKKIADNPSYQKLRTEMEQFSILGKVLQHFDPKIKEALKKLPDLQEQLENIAKTPDEFNHYYSERGWIAYESMKADIMNSAVSLAKDCKIEEGEKILMDYYSPENL